MRSYIRAERIVRRRLVAAAIILAALIAAAAMLTWELVSVVPPPFPFRRSSM
jgi:hypothetical protein